MTETFSGNGRDPDTLAPDERVVFRGKRWVVIDGPKGGTVLFHNCRWFPASELGAHRPNWHRPEVEYSVFSHIAAKAVCDFDDWETVYRYACSYFEVDTHGWLNKEIEHARAMRQYSAAYDVVYDELFPRKPGEYGWPTSPDLLDDTVEVEVARRGIVCPEARM